MTFPFFKQADSVDCGPSCLRMIARLYGKNYTQQFLRSSSFIDKQGVNLKGISSAAEKIGFRSLAVKVPFENNSEASLLTAPLPAIAHWNQNHFVVVYKANKRKIWVADPAKGKFKLSRADFERGWLSDRDKGILLLVETTPLFYEREGQKSSWNFFYLFKYLRPYARLILQLCLGLLLAVVFQMIFPFLTQSIVDVCIQNNNLNFIYLILFAQLILTLSQTAVQFMQNWILLHISTRVNVSLIADFLLKLMKLPIGFFDSKNIGDLLQRNCMHKA